MWSNKELYTAKQIEAFFTRESNGKKVVQIKVSKIQDYVLKKYVVAEEPGEGPGTTRYFSPRNIVEISLVQELFLRTVHRDYVNHIMDYFRIRMADIEDGSRLLNPLTPPSNDKLILTVFFFKNNAFDKATVHKLTGPTSKMDMPPHRSLVSIEVTRITKEVARQCFGYNIK